MTGRLADKVIVITGAGGGIGRAAAERVLAEGAQVLAVDLPGDGLDATMAAIETHGKDAVAMPADVTQETQVRGYHEEAARRFGGIDGLFNNAGIAAPPVPVDELPVDAWDRVMAVNLRGSFLCARAAFGRMRCQDPTGGRIINNGSVSATTPRPFSAPYTSSKHAITGLTKSLALDGRDLGITCGQIDIGNAASEMVVQMASGILQPDGSVQAEATMDVAHVGAAVVHMASLPPDANVLSMTVMANRMPFIGRG